MSQTENNQEAKTLAQLVVHIDYMRAQMDELAKKMSHMATQDDIDRLRKEIEAKIEANSPSAMFSQITKVAIGIVAVGAASGVVLAFLKAFKAI